MTERDAFLAAIAAAPDDDLPKLVFADWLDERNDPAAFEQREAVALRRVLAAPEDDRPRLEYAAVCEQYDGQKERAEFIRVQCELANLRSAGHGGHRPCPVVIRMHENLVRGGQANPSCPKCDSAAELEARERDLWVQHCTKWFGNPNRLYRFNAGHPEYATGGIVFNVLRGFVSHIWCSLAEWCGGVCDWSGYSGDHSECRHCDGTGRMTAIGPQVVRRHPVERVVLVDREPYAGWVRGAEAYYWSCPRWETARDVLPQAVYDLIPDLGLSSDGRSMKGFRTRELAISVMSDAAIVWAKGTS